MQIRLLISFQLNRLDCGKSGKPIITTTQDHVRSLIGLVSGMRIQSQPMSSLVLALAFLWWHWQWKNMSCLVVTHGGPTKINTFRSELSDVINFALSGPQINEVIALVTV